MDWRAHAACLGADPELFFPRGTTALAWDTITEAKAICAGCPVRERCLEWALATGQDTGIWGGMDEDERRAYRRTGRPGRTGP